MNSILLVDQGKILERSDAVLRIAAGLRFPWNLLKVFKILPTGLRDRVYDWIADNRYRWFGRKDRCLFGIPEYENRFI